MGGYHTPVLFFETIDSLNIKPEGVYIDCTAGGGGHSSAIAQRLEGSGRLISIDRDPDAIKQIQSRLGDNKHVTIVKSSFSDISRIARENGVTAADGILMDLGVSSHQLDCRERGFSYHGDAPLDMRMTGEGTSAADLVATLDQKALADIFFKYGEERYSNKIAASICREREKAPIETTAQLADIIRDAYPAAARRDAHPARKVFQALRIAVNDELGELERVLPAAFELLGSGGRLAVITFHSLEDRMAKRTMASWCEGCTCPPQFPVCVCGKKPQAKLVTRKPVIASQQELEENPRSRSAKLRVCEKI
ncbi:MAG: 16S rRNA (cytosine(1402)-N(4))-methyltransferase RsmH [Clostridia bacterium]|nr:16S rRNA (cytosine(1402)-N(4))-methyltransferase RsmH [Clostridia bacterium]